MTEERILEEAFQDKPENDRKMVEKWRENDSPLKRERMSRI